MHAQSYTNTLGYLIILIGLILSFLSAFVPFFEAGYKLMTSVVIVGMLPYIVYAMAVPLCRSTMTSVLGVIIVIAHAFLVFNERIIGKADYDNGLIYYGPILIAVAVIPFVLITINNLKSFKAN